MRGDERVQDGMFSYVTLEQRVPQDHPLREIRKQTDVVLRSLSGRFDELYADTGRSSIAPEYILRALLLQAFYSVRSERQLREQIDYNLRFRWFVGLGLDDPIWNHAVFSKNRNRLLNSEMAQEFFAAVKAQARRFISDDHFTVDGTLIQAWASQPGGLGLNLKVWVVRLDRRHSLRRSHPKLYADDIRKANRSRDQHHRTKKLYPSHTLTFHCRYLPNAQRSIIRGTGPLRWLIPIGNMYCIASCNPCSKPRSTSCVPGEVNRRSVYRIHAKRGRILQSEQLTCSNDSTQRPKVQIPTNIYLQHTPNCGIDESMVRYVLFPTSC